MREKVVSTLVWIRHRPLAIINLLGLMVIVFGFAGVLYYQDHRDINVLEDWKITVSSPKETRVIDGKTVAVYHPNETLVFTSQSHKLIEAEGVSLRTIVCEATGTQKAREIQLDQIPATRPAGSIPKRESAITVPDVAQFAGLPRWCVLRIDVTYKDVLGTGRTQQEHAETERFLVEEQSLTTQQLLDKIQSLEDEINTLKSQLPTGASVSTAQPTAAATPSTPRSTTNNTTNNSTTNNSTTNNTTTVTEEDDRSALGKLPVVGGLLNAIGL